MKSLARFLATACVVPAAVRFALSARLLGRDRAFASLCQRASRWTGLGGAYLRVALLRLVGCRVAEDCRIEFGTLLSRPGLVIESGAYVGCYCCLGDVRIGRKTMLGDAVCIPSGGRQHGAARLDVPMADQPGELATVTLGEDCWIGSRAVVLADVGDHAIVAAGAVVVDPVEPYTIVAGCPAKPIGRRDGAP